MRHSNLVEVTSGHTVYNALKKTRPWTNMSQPSNNHLLTHAVEIALVKTHLCAPVKTGALAISPQTIHVINCFSPISLIVVADSTLI